MDKSQETLRNAAIGAYLILITALLRALGQPSGLKVSLLHSLLRLGDAEPEGRLRDLGWLARSPGGRVCRTVQGATWTCSLVGKLPLLPRDVWALPSVFWKTQKGLKAGE